MKTVLTSLVTLALLSVATPAVAECRQIYMRTYSLLDMNSDGVISSSESIEAKSNVDWFANNPGQWESFGVNFSSYFLYWDFDRSGKLDKDDQTLYNTVIQRRTGCEQAKLSAHSQSDGFGTASGSKKDGYVSPLDLLNGYRKIYDALIYFRDLLP